MLTSGEKFNRVSLNEQVAKRLLENIRSQNKPGDRLPSEAALSKQLGVSVITLRESLSVLAHRGLIERRHGSGTYVADPAATQWVAIVTNLDLSHPNLSYFHRRVAYLLRALLADAGLRVHIYSGSATGSFSDPLNENLPQAVFEDLKLDLVRAVIALPSKSWQEFKTSGVPVVGTHPSAPLSVSLPLSGLFSSALQTMASQGCRTAALLGWNNDPAGRKSWEKELVRHNMTTRLGWTLTDLDRSDEAAGWHAFRSLWNAYKQKPDCVVITDDTLFREAALAILHERVEVPRRLRVFTHFNKGSRMIVPFHCTTFQVDPDAYAKELASLCIRIIGPKPPESKHVLVPIEILDRSAPSDQDSELPSHRRPGE
ncbi:MAG: GntR family transcriptional regulator [Verrucomicrobia bacterium]|nr:GntR family transcriptional regulator [Verrucomicrobiota bacterium]